MAKQTHFFVFFFIFFLSLTISFAKGLLVPVLTLAIGLFSLTPTHTFSLASSSPTHPLILFIFALFFGRHSCEPVLLPRLRPSSVRRSGIVFPSFFFLFLFSYSLFFCHTLLIFHPFHPLSLCSDLRCPSSQRARQPVMILLPLLAAFLCSSAAAVEVVYLGSQNLNGLPYFDPSSRSTGPVYRRQVFSTEDDPSSPKIDFSAYLNDAKLGCTSRIKTLDKSQLSDSGLAACYNVPVFDPVRGLFEAELRMYNISAPSGSWKNIRASDITLSLQYYNATVESIPALTGLTTMTRAPSDSTVFYPPDKPSNKNLASRGLSSNITTSIFKEMKTYTYSGALNTGVNATELSM